MDFYEWRDFGVDKGWIDMPVCATHDWFNISDEESELMDEYDNEVCIFASRYNEEKIAGSE